MITWRLSWREFRRRPARTLLTLLSIVIGVAAVLAVSLAISNTRVAQKSMLQSVVGQTHFEVYAEGGVLFDQSIVAKIREVPGLKLVTPVIRRFTNMFYGDNKSTKLQFLGVDPKLDQEVRDYKVVSGEKLTDYEQVLLDQSFASSLGLVVGEQVEFQTQTGKRKATIVGLTRSSSASAATQGSLAILPLPTLQRWTRSGTRIELVQIVVEDENKLEESKALIQAALTNDLRVRVPALRSEMAKESTVALDHSLGMASAFSFMLGIFVIYNTFQMNIGERRRQLGILRALGTTRGQIIRMIFIESLLLGICGTFIGWILGIFAARGLSIAMANASDIDHPQNVLTLFPFFISGICGLAVAIVGAFMPALRASMLSPAEAMKVVTSGNLEPNRKLLLLIGIVISPVGLTVLILCVLGKIHIDHAIAGCTLFLLGYIFTIPSFLSSVSNFIYHLFERFFGVEGRLAQRQLLRHRVRTSLTIGILFLAISMGLGMGNMILDNVRDYRTWASEVLVGDFFIRSTMPGTSNESAGSLPPATIDAIKNVPGVKLVDATSYMSVKANGMSVSLIARDFVDRNRKVFHVSQGNPSAIFDGLKQGEVVIGSVLAERGKLKIGDELQLESPKGAVPLKICGIANDYMNAGLTVYIHRPIAEQLYPIEGSHLAIIDASPDQIDTVEKEIKRLCDEDGLIFLSQKELLKIVRSKVDGIVNGLWAVLGLCSLIAAFGLANTLSMSVLEQTAEIGMLRAVAMTRQQVRKTVFLQAVFMGVIGLIPGVFAGLMIAYLLALSVLPTTGHAITFQFRSWLVFGSLAVEMVIVLMASLIPAERASRIPVSQAMQYQ